MLYNNVGPFGAVPLEPFKADSGMLIIGGLVPWLRSHHGSSACFSSSSLLRSCCAISLEGSLNTFKNLSRCARVRADQSSSYEAASVES